MMPNRVTSSRTLHAQRHAHPADRSNLTQTHHYHERLQRGSRVHASEGGARDPGASTTITRSRRDGVETEEVSVQAARSGATCSGVSETSLHQVQRTHSHATEHALYRRCCGKIQHATTCRPDLMHPLKELGRRVSNPRAADRKCLKHLLRDTWGWCIESRATGSASVAAPATDSDWTGCHETRKFTCCGITRWRGVITSSHVRTESVLAQSSPEAEHLEAVALALEMLFVQELVKFTGVETTLEINSSASSAIAMATRRGLERPRHLKVQWPWLHQLVSAGRIRIMTVKGVENLPDVGTKFVVKTAQDTRRKGLGLTRIGNGVAVILTNPTHMGAAILMMLITGVSAEPQEAQTCWISWTVLIVDAAECDSSHRHRQGIHAPNNAEASEMTRQATEDTGTHQPRSVHVAHQ